MSLPEAFPELLSVLEKIVKILDERGADYALIGGLGLALRGPVRATRDIDLLLNIPQLQLPGLLEQLCGEGFSLDVTQAIATWNRDHLLDFFFGSIRIDWLKPVLPVFQHVLARARTEQIAGQQVRVADAEGLILLKLIAFRPRDQEDIKGILAANSGRLDLDWIRSEWKPVAGGEVARTAEFETLIRDFYVPGRAR
jgi:predicted nucleotidyltransferase